MGPDFRPHHFGKVFGPPLGTQRMADGAVDGDQIWGWGIQRHAHNTLPCAGVRGEGNRPGVWVPLALLPQTLHMSRVRPSKVIGWSQNPSCPPNFITPLPSRKNPIFLWLTSSISITTISGSSAKWKIPCSKKKKNEENSGRFHFKLPSSVSSCAIKPTSPIKC